MKRFRMCLLSGYGKMGSDLREVGVGGGNKYDENILVLVLTSSNLVVSFAS